MKHHAHPNEPKTGHDSQQELNNINSNRVK